MWSKEHLQNIISSWDSSKWKYETRGLLYRSRVNQRLFTEFNKLYPNLFRNCMEFYYFLVNKDKEEYLSSVFCRCGNKKKFYTFEQGYKTKVCSASCKFRSLDIKETCKNKYGVENPSQSQEIKDKKSKTTYEHYGVEHPLQNKEILKKVEDTMVSKYGVTNAALSKEIQEKRKKKYKASHSLDSKNTKEKVRNTIEKQTP